MNWQAIGDWGTSRLRLYRQEAGEIIRSVEGPGIGKLEGTAEQALRAALASLGPDGPPSAIRLCGMAGARGGLIEVAYANCPADAGVWGRASASTTFDGIPLLVAAGLACQAGNGRPDVMRGEEAQIFGAMALVRQLAQGKALYVLPGTHCKWAEVADGRIVGFRTFLSGELFDLLSSQSTLLPPGPAGTPDDEAAGFVAGLERAGLDGQEPGEGLSALLFATRSLQLRGGFSRCWALGFLSGLVIGDEIATMRRLITLPDRITLIGAPDLCARYAQAFGMAGVDIVRLDGEACVLRGMELLDG